MNNKYLSYLIIFSLIISCGGTEFSDEEFYEVNSNREELYDEILSDAKYLDEYQYSALACNLVVDIIDDKFPMPEELDLSEEVINRVYYRTKLLTSDTMYEFCDLNQNDRFGVSYLDNITNIPFLLWTVGINPNEMCYFGQTMQSYLQEIDDYC